MLRQDYVTKITLELCEKVSQVNVRKFPNKTMKIE